MQFKITEVTMRRLLALVIIPLLFVAVGCSKSEESAPAPAMSAESPAAEASMAPSAAASPAP